MVREEEEGGMIAERASKPQINLRRGDVSVGLLRPRSVRFWLLAEGGTTFDDRALFPYLCEGQHF